MSKTKIQTAKASNFGHKVDFGSVVLQFDKLGFAEVESKEIADKLAANYEGWLYVGEKPSADEKKPSADARELQQDLKRAAEKLADRDATIKASQMECEEWKAQTDKYKKAFENVDEEFAGYRAQKEKEVKELELKVQLTKMTPKDLAAFCVTLEIPEERYKGKGKDETVNIILDESRNK